jgi:hypothetical protein
MAAIKAVWPLASVLSVEAPQERREEAVSSDACKAASISGVFPFFVFGCKETVMMLMLIIHIEIEIMKVLIMFNIIVDDDENQFIAVRR